MAFQSISGASSALSLLTTSATGNQSVAGAKTKGNAPAGKAGGGGGAPKSKPASSSNSSGASSSDTKIYDKMDTNKDGVVSVQEKTAYLLAHPEETDQNNESNNYNGQGNQTNKSGNFSAIINLSA